MRRAAALLVLLALVAGCTSFPGTSRIVGEFEPGTLAPGDAAVHHFTLAERADFLFVGYRTGPGEHVHVVLRSPSGERWDTAAEPGGGCAVTRPAAGPWALEVAADALDGRLEGGKFTVRSARGEVPAVLGCRDDAFPGKGRNVTLGWWSVNLTAGQDATFAFDQPLAVDRVEAAVLHAAANATLAFTLPDGSTVPATLPPAPPPRGPWQLTVALPADAAEPLQNATLVVRAWG